MSASNEIRASLDEAKNDLSPSAYHRLLNEVLEEIEERQDDLGDEDEGHDDD